MVRMGKDSVEPMTFLLGIWLAVSGLGGVGLVAMGAFSLLAAEPDFFPGDPPIADLCVGIALMAWPFILIGLCAALAMARFIERDSMLRKAGKGVAALLALSFVSLAPALAQVGRRHFGEWRQLKAMLQQGEAQVLELVQRQGGVLSDEEYARARTWFQEHPTYVQFKDLPHPVQVRMMSPSPPYVGADFGDGSNAVFDLSTMLCTYSD